MPSFDLKERAGGVISGPTFYLENYQVNGALVYGGLTGDAANGAALRAALDDARLKGGGIIQPYAGRGFLRVDWVAHASISGSVGSTALSDYCHGAAGDGVFLGSDLKLVAGVFPFLNGTIWNRGITNLDLTAGNQYLGYEPGFRYDANAAQQALLAGPNGNGRGLGPTAGGSYGDDTFVQTGFDTWNCSNIITNDGYIQNIRGTGADHLGVLTHSSMSGADLTNPAAWTIPGTFTAQSSTAAFVAAGTVSVMGSLGAVRLQYTSRAGNTFIGCIYVSGPAGSLGVTGNRAGYVETWAIRHLGATDFSVRRNHVSGLDRLGVQNDTATGIATQTSTNGAECDNDVHDLKWSACMANHSSSDMLIAENRCWNGGLMGQDTEDCSDITYAFNHWNNNNVLGALGNNLGSGMTINGTVGGTCARIVVLANEAKGNYMGSTVQHGGGTLDSIDYIANIFQSNTKYGLNVPPITLGSVRVDRATLAQLKNNNAGGAQIWLQDLNAAAGINALPGTVVATGAGVAQFPAVPATGVASAISPFLWPVELEITAGAGGSFTGLTINGVVLTIPAIAAGQVGYIPIPWHPGNVIVPVYTGAAPVIRALVDV